MKLRPLMVQGTGSHVGKSFIVAALCRIFLRRGIEPAPFKAQNMANNAASVSGGEIGRAQALQAAAARLDPDVRMNPVLLKPSGERRSQVVLMGHPIGTFGIRDIDRQKPQWFKQVRRAFRSLSAESDVVVIEGAGSPAEINLRHVDYANMRVAAMASARVLLVGDIERGGVFASLIGTSSLLSSSERSRVIGYVINKFRGDPSLLTSGIRFLRKNTGIPVLGVIPHGQDIRLPEEDSIALGRDMETRSGGSRRRRGSLVVGLVRYPRIANFTDIDPLRIEPDIVMKDVRSSGDLSGVHVLILPGSKNVFEDIRFLHRTGLFDDLSSESKHRDMSLVGICGGLQILGEMIDDSEGIEDGVSRSVRGLGRLPVRTRFHREKIVRPVEWVHPASREMVRGYEIRHGRIHPRPDVNVPMFRSRTGKVYEGSSSGRVWGTLTHGVFDADGFRTHVLNRWRRKYGLPVRPPTRFDVESSIEQAADLVEEHLDVNAILRHLK